MINIKEYAEQLIKLIRERLKEDEYFDNAKYSINGNKISISFYIKQAPGFRYEGCVVTVDEFSVVEEDVDNIVEHWMDNIDSKSVKMFTSFIRDIERWGTG